VIRHHVMIVLISRVDLRSIMAETEASAPKPRPAIPTSISGSIRPSAASFTPPKASSAGAPWRAVDQVRPSLSAVQAAQVGSPPPTANSFPGLGRSPATPAQASSSRQPSGSKVFTPTKIPSATITRKASR
jgi:hypothetical protein